MFNNPFTKGWRVFPGVSRSKKEVVDLGWQALYFVVTQLDPLIPNAKLHSALSGAELHIPKIHALSHRAGDTDPVDHDTLLNWTGNKHIDHTLVSISAGTGLSGGGDISASRTLVLSHLGIEALTDPGADKLMLWDDTDGAVKFIILGANLSYDHATHTLNVTGAGYSTFLSLTDTPASYAGSGDYLVRVNAGANALEFLDPTSDFLSQYVLLAGRASGQVIQGGLVEADWLVLQASAANAYPEIILWGMNSPSATVQGMIQLLGGRQSGKKGGDLWLVSGDSLDIDHANGDIYLWTGEAGAGGISVATGNIYIGQLGGLYPPNLLPTVDNVSDIGSDALRIRNLKLGGYLLIGSLAAQTVEGRIWSDSTNKAIHAYVNGLNQAFDTTIFTAIADATVGFSTVEGTLLAGTTVTPILLPAGFLVPGKTISFTVRGNYGTKALAGGTLTLKVKLGANVVLTAVQTPPAGMAGREFEIKGEITCRTAGVGGSVMAHGFTMMSAAANSIANQHWEMGAPLAVIFDTRPALAFNVTAQWALRDVANTITGQTAVVGIRN